jgi:hypothetical protein
MSISAYNDTPLYHGYGVYGFGKKTGTVVEHDLCDDILSTIWSRLQITFLAVGARGMWDEWVVEDDR